MARPELGTKHTCPECEKKFYDLNRDGATCPACGYAIAHEQDTPEEKEIPVVVKGGNGLKPPESGDDFDDDEAGVIDDDKDLADLSDEADPGKDVAASDDEDKADDTEDDNKEDV